MAATAATIINNVAIECGLASVADPYASTDQNFILLRTLLNSAGRELLRERDWSWAVKEATITGTGAQTDFAVPTDFVRFVNRTGWDRTSDQPFSDPLTGEEWQTLKAWSATVAVTVLWRFNAGQVKFYTAPANADDLRYEYLSSYWTNTVDAVIATQDLPTAATHYVILDEPTITRLLKVKFLQAKGLDANATLLELRNAYANAVAREPARVLHVAPGTGFPFLSARNLPDTGYGA